MRRVGGLASALIASGSAWASAGARTTLTRRNVRIPPPCGRTPGRTATDRPDVLLDRLGSFGDDLVDDVRFVPRNRDLVDAHGHADERQPDAIVVAVLAQPDAARAEAVARAVGTVDHDLDLLAARDVRCVADDEASRP